MNFSWLMFYIILCNFNRNFSSSWLAQHLYRISSCCLTSTRWQHSHALTVPVQVAHSRSQSSSVSDKSVSISIPHRQVQNSIVISWLVFLEVWVRWHVHIEQRVYNIQTINNKQHTPHTQTNTDRQTERHTHRQTDRQTKTERERERERERGGRNGVVPRVNRL